MSEFRGKTVVITGGNSGIGFESAKKFYSAGANIAITGRNIKTLELAKKELGPDALAMQVDVTDLSQIDRFVETTISQFGSIDILFANAGIGEMRSIQNTDEELYDLTMNTNVKGVFFTIKKFLPYMNNGGSVILNSSIANSKGTENLSIYSASKAAVRSLARTLTSELKSRGIRVNSVSPGPIATPFLSKTDLTQEQIDHISAAITNQVPMGRFGYSAEVADTVYWLASSSSSYVTGIDLPVDGGIAQV